MQEENRHSTTVYIDTSLDTSNHLAMKIVDKYTKRRQILANLGVGPVPLAS